MHPGEIQDRNQVRIKSFWIWNLWMDNMCDQTNEEVTRGAFASEDLVVSLLVAKKPMKASSNYVSSDSRILNRQSFFE